MPHLNFPEAIIILDDTPPNPGFTMLIDDLVKEDEELAQKVEEARDNKDEQIKIIMESETAHVLKLLREGKFPEALKARYRLTYCAEVERQKLVEHNETTREELITRFLAISVDIEELSNRIVAKYPKAGFRDGTLYTAAPVLSTLKRKSNIEIHNRTSQLWLIDGLKRQILKGDGDAMATVKAIELREEEWCQDLTEYLFVFRPRIKVHPKYVPKLEPIAEVDEPAESAEPTDLTEPTEPTEPTEATKSTEPTESIALVAGSEESTGTDETPSIETDSVSTEPQPDPVPAPREESIKLPKKKFSFRKRMIANITHRWLKLRAKLSKAASRGVSRKQANVA
ncbi:hypothetical protein TWF730_008080 [Orbilia blumenaviensis]|uniref:Uncharacterized protein n=1 Tax=Orbilia blumenaviensis TaxID=1796055 RepID=A0AAV9VCX4_9PEZI